jgi:hypothetical protein
MTSSLAFWSSCMMRWFILFILSFTNLSMIIDNVSVDNLIYNWET